MRIVRTLVAFIASYAAVIIAAITFISDHLPSAPNKTENPQNKIENPEPPPRRSKSIFFIALVIAVIAACLAYFTWGGTDEPGGNKPTIAVGTTEESLEVETVPKKIIPLSEDAYSIVEASSTYNGDRATHIPYNLLDGNPKTNWTEGASGYGEGEWVDFHFQEKQSVAGFTIWAGNHYDDSYYVKNARPKTITLTFSDGSTQEYALRDKREEQTFYFDQAAETESVCLTITSVYTDGAIWQDTVISEISFLVEEY